MLIFLANYLSPIDITHSFYPAIFVLYCIKRTVVNSKINKRKGKIFNEIKRMLVKQEHKTREKQRKRKKTTQARREKKVIEANHVIIIHHLIFHADIFYFRIFCGNLIKYERKIILY